MCTTDEREVAMNRIGKHWIRKADANRLSNSHRLGIHELLVNIERTFERPQSW